MADNALLQMDIMSSLRLPYRLRLKALPDLRTTYVVTSIVPMPSDMKMASCHLDIHSWLHVRYYEQA